MRLCSASITAATALGLARLLKISPQFWMRLQADWDFHRAIERSAYEGVLTGTQS
jgi:plasmid maintenance system antidote protein VapI